LRFWLGDLASELWEAAGDGTLPGELSVDHVWITAQGRAVVLDEPWPGVQERAEAIAVEELAGQQRFLSAVAACAESTSLPLHARGVLSNLGEGKFEKLSFLTGTLRGLLDRPAEVSRGIRAGASFVVGFYVWVTVFVGLHTGGGLAETMWGSSEWIVVTTAMLVLGAIALIQLVELALLRTTASSSIFRLAVVNVRGELAGRPTLLRRWAIIWLPLIAAMLGVAVLVKSGEPTAALVCALAVLVLWLGGAFCAVIHPNRGLHDRLAGTWVVRQ